MSIIELINKIGIENVSCQYIDGSSPKYEIKNSEAKITFYTDYQTVLNASLGNPDKVGLIVWMPKDKFDLTIQNE